MYHENLSKKHEATFRARCHNNKLFFKKFSPLEIGAFKLQIMFNKKKLEIIALQINYVIR